MMQTKVDEQIRVANVSSVLGNQNSMEVRTLGNQSSLEESRSAWVVPQHGAHAVNQSASSDQPSQSNWLPDSLGNQIFVQQNVQINADVQNTVNAAEQHVINVAENRHEQIVAQVVQGAAAHEAEMVKSVIAQAKEQMNDSNQRAAVAEAA